MRCSRSSYCVRRVRGDRRAQLERRPAVGRRGGPGGRARTRARRQCGRRLRRVRGDARHRAQVRRAAGGVVARVITSGDFKGKRDETTLLYPTGAKPERVLLVGLGKPGEVTRTAIRRAAAVAAKRARALGAKQLAFAVAPEARNGVSARDLGQAAGEGAAQGAWP